MGAATALTVGSLGLSAAQAISGGVRTSKAKKALDNYDRQTLTNPYEDLAPSTLGAEMRIEAGGRRTASSLAALQQGGLRALSGGVSDVAMLESQEMESIQASIDEQMQEINRLKAQGEMQIQQMQEAREQQDIAGLGAEMEAGKQTMWSGLGGMSQTAMNAATLYGENPDLFKADPIKKQARIDNRETRRQNRQNNND